MLLLFIYPFLFVLCYEFSFFHEIHCVCRNCPLHLAVNHDVPVLEVLEELIAADSGQVLVHNNLGLLPVDL